MIEVTCSCHQNKHKSRNHTRKKLAVAVRKAKARQNLVNKAKKILLNKKVAIVNKGGK